MGSMSDLYQQVILDHARARHGATPRGALSGGLADASAVTLAAQHAECTVGQTHQVNPMCGDEVTLHVEVGGEGTEPVIQSVVWDGDGCSISQASLSVMHDLAVGRPLREVAVLDESFHALMHSQGKGLGDEDAEDALEDAIAFAGTSQFPARIKCALLGWAALEDALVRAGQPLPKPAAAEMEIAR